MDHRVNAIVCGSSLSMAGLAASLRTNPALDVVRIPADAAILAQELDRRHPRLIAFDLGELSGDLVFALLRDHPGVTLLGFDPSADRMLVLSGRREQPLSAAELVESILRSP